MVEKKTDRRILKTKRALRESLLYLLKEQPIQKISVSRLCEKSDIMILNSITLQSTFPDAH